MRPFHAFPSRLPLAALAALSLTIPSAHAAFFAVSRAISRADAALEKGIRAEEEGRRKEAFDFYDDALTRFADIHRDHPDTKPEYIVERIGECRSRMLAIFAEAERNLQPDGPVAAIPIGEPETSGLPENEIHALEELPPVPEAPSPAPEAPSPAPEAPQALAGVPAGIDRPAPSDEPPPEEPEDAPPAEEFVGRPPVADDPAAPLDARVESLLATNRAPEAVLLMDAAIGEDEAGAPAGHLLLLARALLASGNAARAIVVLDGLVAQQPDDPAVLTLAAGAHLAHGNAYSAVRVLDELVRRHPRYADAYIDLAYTRFAMDPDGNRDEAVLYYKHALAFGAARDPRLEAELGVTVLP